MRSYSPCISSNCSASSEDAALGAALSELTVKTHNEMDCLSIRTTVNHVSNMPLSSHSLTKDLRMSSTARW